MHKKLSILISYSAFLFSAQASSFTLYLENDILNERDANYTHGTRLLWLTDAITYEDATKKQHGYVVGQSIYTSEDIDAKELLPENRPYAGWLYGGYVIQNRYPDRRTDWIEFDIGMVGPSSYAEKTQTEVHRLFHNHLPQGWSHQIKDELGLVALYEQRRLVCRGNYYDIWPHWGFSLGNVQTYVNVGFSARLGFNLPEQYPV